MKLSVIIPLYNEAMNVAPLRKVLVPLLHGLADNGSPETETISSVELVFVDDGSTDGTYDRLSEAFGSEIQGLNVRLGRHPHNRGLGAALRTGFRLASGDVQVTTDGDGTYRFEEIPRLLACLTPRIDIVTASPYHPDGGVAGVPAYRLLLSRGSSLIYRVLVEWRVYTYTALFRAYRRKVIETVPFEADGFLAGTELLVKAMLAGYRVAECPAVLHRRAFGSSKAKLLRTMLAHLRFQARVMLHRLKLRPLWVLPPAQTGRTL